MPESTVGQTKQFGKGQRTVPKPEQKAQKWYPVDEESQPKKVSTPCLSIMEELFARRCIFYEQLRQLRWLVNLEG